MEELTFGLLGGFLLGPTVELIYVTTLCQEAPDPGLCHGLGLVTMQMVIYTFTLPLGASAGVIFAGAWRGIPSDLLDWLSTYVFAMVGSWTGWLNAIGIVKISELLMEHFGWSFDVTTIYTMTRVSLPILYAALFGAVGFNAVIAHPSSGLSAPAWWPPLFTVRF